MPTITLNDQTSLIQEWITNDDYSLIACVVNCAGNPATGEYVYDGGSIVYGYGGGSEPLPLFQTASLGSLLSLAGLCNVNFSNIDFTDSGVDDITSDAVVIQRLYGCSRLEWLHTRHYLLSKSLGKLNLL